jgi:hypothetical protein
LFERDHALFAQGAQAGVDGGEHLGRLFLGVVEPVAEGLAILGGQMLDGLLDFLDGAHGEKLSDGAEDGKLAGWVRGGRSGGGEVRYRLFNLNGVHRRKQIE